MTRQEQRDARRQAIEMTALELFVTRGYYDTKISDIAAAAHMSVGLLFRYFASKEQLLCELVRLGVEGTRYPETLAQLPPEAYFRTFLEQLFQYAREQRWVFYMFVLVGQARRVGMPEEARRLAQEVDQIEFSARIIRRGQEQGVFRAGDPLALAQCFWAGVQGVMEEMALAPDRPEPEPDWLMAMLLKQ